MSSLLVDNGSFLGWQLVEDDKSGKLIARGEFAKVGIPTANGRIYPRKLWERELGRLSKKLGDRQVFGELDHPMDGKTKLGRVSHILTNLRIEGDLVVGEAEIVDTSKGKDLKALLRSGGKVGVSSRGFGTTIPDGKGNSIVSEDYKLMTFDFVADPADETATPDVFSEDKELEAEMANLTLEALKDKHPELVKNIEDAAKKAVSDGKSDEIDSKVEAQLSALKEEFQTELLDKIVEMKDEVREEARGELLSDPATGLARTTIDKIKEHLRPHLLPEDVNEVVEAKKSEIASLKKKISDLESENEEIRQEMGELESVARKVGYRLHLEKKIAEDENAAQIRLTLKDSEFKSVEELDERIEEVRANLKKQKEVQDKKSAEFDSLKSENEKLREALEQALETGKEFGMRTYLEQRLSGHPHAPKLRQLTEGREFDSEDDVDRFLQQYDTNNKPSGEFTRIQESLTRGRRHEGGVIIEGKNSNGNSGQILEDVLGVPIADLRRLMPSTKN